MVLAACAEAPAPFAAPEQPPAAAKVVRASAPLPHLIRDPFLTPAEEAALSHPAARPPQKARASTLRLEALVLPSDGRSKLAIVSGRSYAEGEQIGVETLHSIKADRIELISPDGRRRTLRFESTDAPPEPPAPQGALAR
jgi:hypothetical protein